MPLISIQVTEDIATKIKFMAESGVFAIEKGSATLNFVDKKLLTIKTEIYSHASLSTVNSNSHEVHGIVVKQTV